MNKKVILILSAVLVLGLLTVVIVKSRNREELRSISVSYPEDIKGRDNLSFTLLNSFKRSTGVDFFVNTIDGRNYLNQIPLIKDDLVYVVNNYHLDSSDILDYSYRWKGKEINKLSDNLKSLRGIEDSYYYIPVTYEPWIIYYNKDVFSELGLSEPKTFRDLEDLCKALIEKDITPFSMVQNVRWPLSIWFDYINIRLNGIEFHNSLLQGYKPFNSKEVKESYIYLYKLIENGWFKSSNSDDWEDMIRQFNDGETAMILGSSFLGLNRGNSFSFPKLNYEGEIISTSGYLANKNSKNIKGVKKFLNFALSGKGVEAIESGNLYNSVSSNHFKNSYSKNTQFTASLERNTNPELLIPLKQTLNNLFFVEDEDYILEMLDNLETIRANIK